jgi:hypothetical protein
MRHKLDFYPTLSRYADIGVSLALRYHPKPMVCLDTGAGLGAWGKSLKKQRSLAYLTGIEINESIDRTEDYDYWVTGDYLKSEMHICNLIIGNPPYKHAEEFVHKSLSLLLADGVLCYLLRLNFLEGQKRHTTLWNIHKPSLVAVCSKRPSFTENGKTDMTAYAYFVWQADTTNTQTLVEWV